MVIRVIRIMRVIRVIRVVWASALRKGQDNGERGGVGDGATEGEG